MKLIKQIHIDRGRFGGMIQVVIQSMFIVTIANSIGIWSLFYDKFLSARVPWYIGIAVTSAGLVMWWIFYYSVVHPSVMQYANRQSWVHGSPVKAEFDALNKRLDQIEEIINEGKHVDNGTSGTRSQDIPQGSENAR